MAISEIAVASIGIALVVCAVLANQRWLDRHFLPSWFLPHRWYVLIESSVRVVMAAVGVSLALPRACTCRTLHRDSAGTDCSTWPRGGLALGASELVLRRVHAPRGGVAGARRRAAPPSRSAARLDLRAGASPATTTVGARVIDYSFDPAGYRVRRVDEPVDPEQPTILFVGESVMFGEGLTWEESVPAQVGAMMGIQSANLAVHGFGTDQAYLRLEMELPRFRRPVAVVSLFMTALFGRNLDDDRPHLGPGLVWLPAAQHGRLASLAKLLVPYRSRRDRRARRRHDTRSARRHRRIWRARAGRPP